MRTRPFAAALLVGVLATALVACSDDGDSSSSSTTAPDPTSTTSADDTPPPSTPGSTGRVRGIEVGTPAFADGELIPVEYTCAGAGTAPELEWSAPPDGTEQMALIVNDPDARGGAGFVHYVGWGIDPAARRLTAEGYGQATLGANGTGGQGWVPPCPPPGEEPHRYEFTLYALSGAPEASSTTDMFGLQAAMRDLIVTQGTVTGRFGR
jgi:Raf kinase inhibitor-like YbhB/YbcL family protein